MKLPIRFHRIFVSPVAALLLALCSSGAAAGSAREQLDGFLASVASVRAQFIQHLYDEKGELLEESSGAVYLKRPGRFRWDYDEPFAQSIITDGEILWFYDVDLAQATVGQLATAGDSSPAALLGNSVDIDARYAVDELPDEGDLAVVSLTPKSTENQYQAIQLAFADNTLRRMSMHDNFGQQTVIEFDDISEGIELDDDMFNFVPPPGVDIVEAPVPDIVED